jgi:hypothetical protein
MFGMPFPVQFFLAFVIVLGLIGATAWAVRRFGTGRLGGANLRGRQPRLAVIDYASVDGRRRLILVRRDNVEHLLMIGGPSDIVVEPNIVRAVPATRDVPMARPTAAEALPRAIPLPDNAGSGAWPLQPEPAATASSPRQARGEPAHEEPAAWALQPHGEAAPRVQRDTLAALADELSARPAPQRPRQPANARQHPPEQRGEPRMPNVPFPDAEAAQENDQSLAEMAHRLESALRKPNTKADSREGRAPAMPRAALPGDHGPSGDPAPAPPPRATRAPEAKPPRADAKQPNAGKALYDSLEQEMASLLGRPANKP